MGQPSSVHIPVLKQRPQPVYTPPPVSPTDYTLYQPEGLAYSGLKDMTRESANPDNPWYVRAGCYVLGTLVMPVALAEEYVGRTAMNVPFHVHNAGIKMGEHAARASILIEQEEYAEATVDVLLFVQNGSEGFVAGASALAPIAGKVGQLRKPAAKLVERGLEKVGQLPRKLSAGKLGLSVHARRFFLQDTKKYPGVSASWGGRLLKKLFPNAKWQQGHVFIQQAWTRTGSQYQKFPNNWLANSALQRLGNAGWNLIPMPASLNNKLGKSAAGTAGAAIVIYGILLGEAIFAGNRIHKLHEVITEEGEIEHIDKPKKNASQAKGDAITP